MKFLKRLTLIIVFISLISLITLYFTDNLYLFRALKLTYLNGEVTANIDDHLDFENNKINNGKVQEWDYHSKYNKLKLNNSIAQKLDSINTTSLLIIKDNKIIFEEYYDGYTNSSLTNSFSMAKTITTMLIGFAIQDGLIKGFDDKIVDYLPEFKNDKYGKECTIGDLSAMTSGYDWDENYYMPINEMTKAYYDGDIEEQVLNRKFVELPGGHFDYKSGNTQLLGIILKRVLKSKSISQYLSEKLWKPLGMHTDALWSLDEKKGMEKTYCCINSNAQDFAKLGQLLLQNGYWKGKQLLNAEFVKLMTTPNTKAFDNDEIPKYGYSIWLDYSYNIPFYSFIGHLGQNIIVIPSQNIVIVRLGKKRDNSKPKIGILPSNEAYYLVDEAVEMASKLN